MTPEQIREAYERDKNLAVNNMQANVSLWRYERTREAVRRASWDISEFNSHYLDSANAYDHWEEKHRKEHPEWFSDEHADLGGESAVGGGGSGEANDDIRSNMATLPAIANSLVELHKRLNWVWWFALGGLVVAFGKH